MRNPKDMYFEFILSGEGDLRKHCVVERKRIISIEEIYPDELEFPSHNKSNRQRTTIHIQVSDSEVREIDSTEKYEKLIQRLYKRPFSGVK